MPLTKVTKSGINNNAIDADKLEDGTILAADITPGTITADKLTATLDLSSKTVTLPNTSVTNAMLAGSIANAKLANSSLTINGTSVSLGSSISAGSLDWQTVQTTGFNATAGKGYFCNTTSAAFTVTLPASPTIGDTIALVDYAGTFATNKLTIARNGNKIQGVENNSQIGTNRASVTLVYVDATRGWVYQNESNVADLAVSFISATGGTILTSGNFKTHVFTGDGSFVVSTLGNPAGGPSNVDYLVVAGGGGGGVGGASGGGGGAGGYRTTFPSPGCNAGSFPISVTTYPITVGGGGAAGAQPRNDGTSGSNSIFSTITSTGGGGGAKGCAPNSPAQNVGLSGGSGGGGGSGSTTTGPATSSSTSAGGSGNSPPVNPSQGNPGGVGRIQFYTYQGGGGGGGFGAAGTDSTGPAGANIRGGPGGIGGPIADSFFGPTSPSYGTPGPVGSTRYFSGGGAGKDETNSTGGIGGAGGGADSRPTTNAGTTNTGGGGGGGASSGPTGAGGKGIVVIRYKFQ